MWKPVAAILLAALGCGVAVLVLRHGATDMPAHAVPAESASSDAQTRPLNQVQLQAPAQAMQMPATDITANHGESFVPIPLATEFTLLLDSPSSMRALHEAIEREPREEPWATLMEGKWNTAFADNRQLLSYGTPNVHCRATRCEIQLITIKTVQLDRMSWMQLISSGANTRAEGDQSTPLVKRVANAVLGSIENNGATVILYIYEYERDPATRQ